ncbi:uncharacterized protein TNCV_287251 [Trichonephila clavipes]|nr:uncharacterized protein TNCV_287251 [Trichonephila clavipes]
MVLCGIHIPDFHKRILFSDEVHFWLNGYVNKQNCRIWSEANPQVYVETPLHPEKLTVWCALWAGGIIGPYFFKNDEGQIGLHPSQPWQPGKYALDLNPTSAIRSRSNLRFFSHQKMIILNSRGGPTSHPSSLIIGRQQKSAHGSRTPKCTIRTELTMTLFGPSGMYWRQISRPRDIWTLVHHAAIVFLKSFSCHLPRRQCSQLDRFRQLSPGGTLLCPL